MSEYELNLYVWVVKHSFMYPRIEIFGSKCLKFVEMQENGVLKYQKVRKEGRDQRKTFTVKPREIISVEERDQW